MISTATISYTPGHVLVFDFHEKWFLATIRLFYFPTAYTAFWKFFKSLVQKLTVSQRLLQCSFFRFVNSRYPYLVWFVMLKGKDMTVPPISAIFPALGFRRFRHRLILSFTALFLSVSEPPLNFLIYQVMIFSVSNFSQFLYGTLLWTKLWQMLVRRILLIAKMVERSCPSDW
jgi:hypothetical protein